MNTDSLAASIHKTVTLTYQDLRAEIDVEIAPLILEIWKADIETVMSCQETGYGLAWIEFASSDDLLRFLDIVAYYEDYDGSLYRRIYSSEYASSSGIEWEYRYNLIDFAAVIEEPDLQGPVKFEAHVGAYFPKSDFPVLLERLQAFNTDSPVAATGS